MSYVYDTMRRVWDERIAPNLNDDELAFRFSALIDAMHSANHRLADGINKDREADIAARKLEQYVSGRARFVRSSSASGRDSDSGEQ
jgi:hypothetical protein